ncbi:hypothetical protein CA236_01160 [Sphingomonas sp. ABOLG]|nr:hypothetical protein CA236_01160 [Sphingomonas sp. ABOLG]
MRALPGRVLSAVIAVDAGFGRSAYDGFRTAQYWTLALGSEAFKNAAYLREISRINQLSFDQPTWDYPTFLRGELEKHEVRKQEIAALLHNNPAGHWPPAQPIEG